MHQVIAKLTKLVSHALVVDGIPQSDDKSPDQLRNDLYLKTNRLPRALFDTVPKGIRRFGRERLRGTHMHLDNAEAGVALPGVRLQSLRNHLLALLLDEKRKKPLRESMHLFSKQTIQNRCFFVSRDERAIQKEFELTRPAKRFAKELYVFVDVLHDALSIGLSVEGVSVSSGNRAGHSVYQ